MILSFRCPETEKIFNEQRSRKFASIHRVAFRKLMMLHAARRLSDLAGPSNSLEALGYSSKRRDLKGRHAIRVNDRFRLCFVWLEGNAADVEIVDYH